MPLNQLIINFQYFILACWPQVSLIMEHLNWDENPYFIDEWLQSNWELLVEKQLGSDKVLLPSYGYDPSPNSRYTKVGVEPTHRIVCKALNNEKHYHFLKFVSKNGGALAFEPPFDFVAVKNAENKIEYLKAENVEFFVEPIE